MDKIKAYKKEELVKLISSLDNPEFSSVCNENIHEADLFELLFNEIKPTKFTDKTVLGIDIYHYSQYKALEQALIPILFKLIYDKVAELSIASSSFIFQKYKAGKNFNPNFINTGDGGFQIFDTPIHALAFAINFQMIVRYYNSHRYFPKLRKIIGPLSLRYALTTDKIYKLDNNFFGTAIINNSRILMKDSLNRFLLDNNTYEWFLHKINGIENLQLISVENLKKLECFKDYKETDGENKIYTKEKGFDFEKMLSCDIQKIGKITAKSTELSIYNLHVQYLGKLGKSEGKTIITLGNLNTSGIN